ncbi:MAG: amidohydrolase family protein [Bryobacteraceae bacterium]
MIRKIAFAVATPLVLLGQSGAGIALVGGTLYQGPEAPAVPNAAVLIRDGAIAAAGPATSVRAPKDAKRIDCRGLTILPGFWNSHVHFFERKWSEAASIPAVELGRQIEDMLTRYGFTSVVDLGSPLENTLTIRARVESGEIPGPRIYTSGDVLLPANPVLPDASILNVLGSMKPRPIEIATPTDARAAVRKLVSGGADLIKAMLSTGPRRIPADALASAVEEAHSAGRPVAAHPNNLADVLTALAAGVDIVAHTAPAGPEWGAELAAAVANRSAALTPTLKIWWEFQRHDRASEQDKAAAAGERKLRAWIGAGGKVLFGTDVSYVSYDPAREYRMMERAGMGFRDILASLTTSPAAQFQARRAGRIEPAMQADLTVVAGDPSRDITKLATVIYTIRNGRIIYRRAEAAPAPTQSPRIQ